MVLSRVWHLLHAYKLNATGLVPSKGNSALRMHNEGSSDYSWPTGYKSRKFHFQKFIITQEGNLMASSTA